MQRTYTFLLSVCLGSISLSSFAAQSEERSCGMIPRPERVEIKHIESNGIGYNQGYTSLEGFFPIVGASSQDWVPFLDMRVNVFNNGQPAVNAGLGMRYLGNSRVWGANLYYDYRKTSHYHYNQVGGGLESLGKLWDFRVNGYFPVGSKESSPYHYRFKEFEGNRMILSNKREFAMTGCNAEVGAHAYQRRKVDLYTALGPYAFTGEGRTAWGGEGRVALTLCNFLRVQLSGSYDNVFKGIVQGEVGLFFTWGGKKTLKKRSSGNCSLSQMVMDRALQRVDRQEIIVVDHKRGTSKAIDPATGKPFTFWFVDNTSHSLGTVESPFNTLLAAESASGPNDILYIFTGDGTDNGMNSGITLKQGQQLLGAGINQKIATAQGAITIPPQDGGLPVISNTNDPSGFGVHLVAGNNVVSGLNVQDTQGAPIGSVFSSAVTITNGSNYLIQNNQLYTLSYGSCISVYGPGNNTSILNNSFFATNSFNFTDGVFFYDILAPVTGSFYIANNLFKGVNDTSGFNDCIGTYGPGRPLHLTSNVTVRIFSNTFTSQVNTGGNATAIDFVADNASLSIRGNYIDTSGLSNVMAGIYLEQDSAMGLFSASLDNNTSITVPPAPGYDFVNTSINPDAMQINFGSSNIGTRSGP